MNWSIVSQKQVAMNSLPSHFSLPYAAFLAYSPRGQSDISKLSREVRDGVKYDRSGLIAKAIKAMVNRKAECLSFLSEKTTLVPVPRSSPLQEHALWPSLRICEELRKAGLGGEICQGLKRVKAVQKAAFANPGQRPEPADHYDSIEWTGGLLPSEDVLLVDDFVTRGSIFIGCGAIINGIFPKADVRAFALIRTMGLVPEIATYVDPCIGTITYEGGKLTRNP